MRCKKLNSFADGLPSGTNTDDNFYSDATASHREYSRCEARRVALVRCRFENVRFADLMGRQSGDNLKRILSRASSRDQQ
jgi:hypothetical protein